MDSVSHHCSLDQKNRLEMRSFTIKAGTILLEPLHAGMQQMKEFFFAWPKWDKTANSVTPCR